VAKTDETPLTVAQKKTLLATGAKMADIRALAAEGHSYEEILDLCESEALVRDTEKQGDADRQAKATKRAMRPENEHAPRISVFHPQGWDARREPICPTYWAGMDVRGDVDSDEEIVLMNEVPPGVYNCTKADGTTTKVTVEVQTDPRGNPTEKKFSFSTSGMNMRNHGSRVSYLKEMLDQAPEPVTKPTQLVTIPA